MSQLKKIMWYVTRLLVLACVTLLVLTLYPGFATTGSEYPVVEGWLRPVVHAQEAGQITGWVVEDSTGKAIKGATVVCDSYQTTTDGLGNFALGNLPVGRYSVVVSKDGFREYTSATMHLLEGMTVDLEVRLRASAEVTQQPTPVPPPAPQWRWIAGASEQFSNVQGRGNWYYLAHDFSGYHDMPWDHEDKWWQWGYPEEKKMDYVKLTLDGGHPGPGVDSVRAWECPLSGSIRIAGRVHKFPEVDINGVCPYIWWTGSLGGDGVNVCIKKNTETLWEKHISGFDHVGFAYDLVTNVAAGDRIYFSINQNQSPEYDGTFFDPGIFVSSDTAVDVPLPVPQNDAGAADANVTFEGEVEQYLDYPGMGVEVRVFDANGAPVPGAKVHTHAYSVDFWDGTGSNGAFRRDGFTHDCTWDITLETENPVTLPVKFEPNKLVIVNFRGKP